MASSYTTSLKIQEIGNGEQSGVWGSTTNTNWTLIEQAVAGVQTITMSNSNYTLTNLNGVSDEARNMVLVVQGTNSGIYQVIIPVNQPKMYVIYNNTTGGYAITIGTTGVGGTLISVPNGVTAQVYTDGTNTYSAQTGSAGNFLVNGNLSVTGNQVDVGNMSVGGTFGVTGTSSLAATSFSVSPTAPTPTTGDNSTKVATTAFVATATGSLGTMASQNANNVAITGGTINGVTGTNSGMTVGTATNATNATNVTGTVGTANGGTGLTSAGASGHLLVSNGSTWTSATLASSGVKLGLGITGEVWNNVTGSRSSGTQYTNTNGYAIAVSAKGTGASSPSIDVYVNGVYVQGFNWQFNGAGAHSGCFTIVPTGATYQLNFNSSGIDTWAELY